MVINVISDLYKSLGISDSLAESLAEHINDIDAVLKSDASADEKRESITLAADCIVSKLEYEVAAMLPDFGPIRDLMVGAIVNTAMAEVH